MSVDEHVEALSGALAALGEGYLVVVTGAGISLASGIPTFRGSDPGAVWKRDVTELGTNRYFLEDPVGTWRWYAGRFDGIQAVAAYWREQYEDLRARSALFRDAFYDSTLPSEVVEAVAAGAAGRPATGSSSPTTATPRRWGYCVRAPPRRGSSSTWAPLRGSTSTRRRCVAF